MLIEHPHRSFVSKWGNRFPNNHYHLYLIEGMFTVSHSYKLLAPF